MPRLVLIVLIGIEVSCFSNGRYEEQKESGTYVYNDDLVSQHQRRLSDQSGIFGGKPIPSWLKPYFTESDTRYISRRCYVSEVSEGRQEDSDCSRADSYCTLESCIEKCNKSSCIIFLKAGKYIIKKTHDLPGGALLIGEQQSTPEGGANITCKNDVNDNARMAAVRIRVALSHTIIANIQITDCDVGAEIQPQDEMPSEPGQLLDVTFRSVNLRKNVQGLRYLNEEDKPEGRVRVWLLDVMSERDEIGIKIWNSRRLQLTMERCEFRSNKHAGLHLEDTKSTKLNISSCKFINSTNGIRWEEGENETIDISDSDFTGSKSAAVSLSGQNQKGDIGKCTTFSSHANNRFYRNTMGVMIMNSKRVASYFNKNLFDMNVEYGIRILQGTRIFAEINDTNFSWHGLSGVYVLTEQAVNKKKDVPQLWAEKKPFINKFRVDIRISNAIFSGNGMAGVLTIGNYVGVRIESSVITQTVGTGIYFYGNRTGRLEIYDTLVTMNGNGILADCNSLWVVNATVNGSADGIKIFDGSIVHVSKSKVFTNTRGIHCPGGIIEGSMDDYTLPWEFGHFVYMNMEFDVRCNVPHRRLYDNVVTCVQARTFLWILSVLTVASDIVLILPPVLHAKRVSRYGVSKTIARACVVSLTLSWCLIGFLLLKLHQATAESHRVGMMQTSLAVPAIGFVCGVVGRLVTEFVTRRWTTMTSIWQHSEEELQLLRKQSDLQKQIRNIELLTQLANLHHQARQAWLRNDGDAEQAQALLLQMKTLAQREHEKLGLLAKQRRQLYDEEVHRMACLVRIRSQKHKEPVQSDVPDKEVLRRYSRRRDDENLVGESTPSSKDLSEARRKREEEDEEEAYIEYIHQQAEWCMPDFCQILTRAVDAVNRANEPKDLIKDNLLPAGSDFRLPFAPETHKLKPERRANAMGRNCALLLASIKLKERGQEKVVNDYKLESDKTLRPVSRYVCDWLRASVITEDPYTLAVLFAVLCHEMTLVRVKNNFIATGLDDIKATNMLANFELDANQAKHVVEIQFLLQDLYTIKFVDHRLYEVIRASRFEEILLKPIFHGAATVVLLDEEENTEVEKHRKPYQRRGRELLEAIDSASHAIESISDFAKKLNPVSKITHFFESTSSWREERSKDRSSNASVSLLSETPTPENSVCTPPSDSFSIELAEIATNPMHASIGLPYTRETANEGNKSISS